MVTKSRSPINPGARVVGMGAAKVRTSIGSSISQRRPMNRCTAGPNSMHYPTCISFIKHGSQGLSLKREATGHAQPCAQPERDLGYLAK